MPHCNADITYSLTVLHFMLYSWKMTVFRNIQETRFSQRSVISCLRQTNREQQWSQATFEIPAMPTGKETTQKLCSLVYSVSLIRLFLCLYSFFSCSSNFLCEICCCCPLTFNCIFLLLSLRSIARGLKKVHVSSTVLRKL